jgi:hypothetical protein
MHYRVKVETDDGILLMATSILKFLESRSKDKVNVTSSNILVPVEKSCYKKYLCKAFYIYCEEAIKWPISNFSNRGRSNVKVKMISSSRKALPQ